ncbi:hypothetical protein ERD78_01380 [Allopusillimonas soli]|uniref:Flagellar hook-length control protein FliK n=2 Tax=Allopusillimonas soli TaxID=659016 RepID=A0A853F6A5_9BURK|nr:flagellar hook-length control protein FliK [Allopusillimonas soli]TEA76717.1 hypothetical protein ERD78_01380 [Allopusillimonas soli]
MARQARAAQKPPAHRQDDASRQHQPDGIANAETPAAAQDGLRQAASSPADGRNDAQASDAGEDSASACPPQLALIMASQAVGVTAQASRPAAGAAVSGAATPDTKPLARRTRSPNMDLAGILSHSGAGKPAAEAGTNQLPTTGVLAASLRGARAAAEAQASPPGAARAIQARTARMQSSESESLTTVLHEFHRAMKHPSAQGNTHALLDAAVQQTGPQRFVDGPAPLTHGPAATSLADLSSLAATAPTTGGVLQGQSVPGTTGMTSAYLSAPLGSPQWAPELGKHFMSIVQHAGGQSHAAELRLDPPDLGPLRISIHMADHVAQASFVSPHAAVRQAIENALPQLGQLLSQAGLSLGQTNVSDQGNTAAQDFDKPRTARTRRSDSVAASTSTVESTTIVRRAISGNLMVDTFA